MTKVVVVGQGYVGLPLALRAAEVGMDVVGYDLDDDVYRKLLAGESHIDDVSNDRLQEALAGAYRPSNEPKDIEDADVVVVCVPTPLTREGRPELGSIIAAGATIGDHVSPGALVVLESTTYPGTTEEIFLPLVLGNRLSPEEVLVAFSPERVDPGNAIYGIKNTPKVVGGVTRAATLAACDFYARFVDEVVIARGAKEAEFAKLLENTFRHVNIALVNEMLRFSNDLSIDVWNAIECAATKPFGYMPFKPGPGVGGHCIPVDPSYLSYRVRAELGYSFRMVELAEEINTAAPLYVADRAWRALNDVGMPVKGSKILLVGISYKPDISDCRETPAAPLFDRLRSWGADVSYHDPFVPEWVLDNPAQGLTSEVDVYLAAGGVDLVVLLQPHSVYDLKQLAASSRLILDTRGVLPTGVSVQRL